MKTDFLILKTRFENQINKFLSYLEGIKTYVNLSLVRIWNKMIF